MYFPERDFRNVFSDKYFHQVCLCMSTVKFPSGQSRVGPSALTARGGTHGNQSPPFCCHLVCSRPLVNWAASHPSAPEPFSARFYRGLPTLCDSLGQTEGSGTVQRCRQRGAGVLASTRWNPDHHLGLGNRESLGWVQQSDPRTKMATETIGWIYPLPTKNACSACDTVWDSQ